MVSDMLVALLFPFQTRAVLGLGSSWRRRILNAGAACIGSMGCVCTMPSTTLS